ncbi:S8 family peptidase [Paenibacillus sp. y28]|uniref:S8 family peptidase n=1 Tax=Paenibacillus sp. y28 TaxID=3129110 RepID=UPI00301669D8
MPKKLSPLVVLCAASTLLISTAGCTKEQRQGQLLSPEHELQAKQSLLENDVSRTDDLCRSQCLLDFQQAVNEPRPASPEEARARLEKLKQEHHHMTHLEWLEKTPAQGPSAAAEAGKLTSSDQALVAGYLDQARQQALAGQTYQSPGAGEGENRMFVLGVPSADGQQALVGVVRQQILYKVENDLRKDLRLVPYPSDNRWKIESVDSDTLRDVKVDHPEDNEGTSHYHVNQVVVKFRQPPSAAELEQIRKDIGAAKMEKLGYTYVFESQTMEAKQLMSYFKQLHVEYVEPHFLYTTNESVVPNDALFSKYQWNLPIIETLKGWDVGRGTDKVIVAVVDTGVDTSHVDLKERLLEGRNMVDQTSPPEDDVGHGTHVAGVISAITNNKEGVAGMSWFNPILPVKVLDHTGAGTTYSVAQGIIWAVDHGAKVINLSLGNYAQAEFLHDAIKYAYDRDVLLIAASGNDNTEKPGYPAAYPEVFAVAATDANKTKASFSNFGDYVDVSAPGVNIPSTYPHNQYAALSGTSMASPHVSALAALIRSVNPKLRNADVMNIMRQTAEDLGTAGQDKYYGYGQIDVVKALDQASQSQGSLTLTSSYVGREIGRIEDKYTGK